MSSQDLESIARSLVEPGKGLLAADESSGTIEKRFKAINVVSTEETRRAYREMLFTTPKLGQYISGVILYDETIRQKTADGTPFTEVLQRQGIVPGIKVDKGAKAMAGCPGEKVTEGLDGLRARFSKWRAVITIGGNIPTDACLEANAHALARYAALCQEIGLVPIVEPEVLMDGTHTIERCEAVTSRTLHIVFDVLIEQKIVLERMLLKPNMVIAAKDCPQQADMRQIAQATVRCLRRHVPAAVPGVVFLSGGQNDVQASENLNAINLLGPHPWEVSYSYGRALQEASQKSWAGDAAKVVDGQKALLRRAQANSSAQMAKYSPAIETAPISLRPSPVPA